MICTLFLTTLVMFSDHSTLQIVMDTHNREEAIRIGKFLESLHSNDVEKITVIGYTSHLPFRCLETRINWVADGENGESGEGSK